MNIMQTITDYLRNTIMTTQGDFLVRGAAIAERLAAVAVGQILKSGGVGAKSAWGVPSAQYIPQATGEFLRDTAGDVVVSGLGFTPHLVVFLSYDQTTANANISVGIDNGSYYICVGIGIGGTVCLGSLTESITIKRAVGNVITGKITATGGDGFTVTFTIAGVAATRTIWLALG